MKRNFGEDAANSIQTQKGKVLWSELFPSEFKHRQNACPVVYLPLGLCEPHGQISAFGLDTIKAEWLCLEAAHKVGGIVAPSLGYHIHESGYHARWLEESVDEENPHMTSMPPQVILQFFLYQLRSFVNAGFASIIVLTGHSGGNQKDLRRIAELFMKHVPVRIWVGSDTELVEGKFEADHAGKYEISQLLYIRPDLVDFNKKELENQNGSGGRFALGANANEASQEYGEEIMLASQDKLCEIVRLLISDRDRPIDINLNYAAVQLIWTEALESWNSWETASPWKEQQAVSRNSRWKNYERLKMDYKN